MGAEARLFEETPDEKEERLLEAKNRTEEMRELEDQKARLFERLAEVGQEQRALAREVYAVEKRQREHLKGIEEHVVSEGQELAHEDIERWAESVYWSFARTNPANPHKYVAKKRCEHPGMYERVVAYVLENGYRQDYGGTPYTVYDFTLHGEPHFCWPMIDSVDRLEESEVFNAKPASMRPEEQASPRRRCSTPGSPARSRSGATPSGSSSPPCGLGARSRGTMSSKRWRTLATAARTWSAPDLTGSAT